MSLELDNEIMTVNEAREIMHESTTGMSEYEVEDLINNMHLLARAFIETVQKDEEFRVNIAYNRGDK